jgi:DtxR family Mn-dependent transcriptional regulator
VKGEKVAKNLIRKHRLWEVFLAEKMKFNWDEVHEIAEELEHIKSNLLTDRIDEFLNFPKFDPHGDPIPDKDGNIAYHDEVSLAELKVGESGTVVAVNNHSSSFLQYLDKLKLVIGTKVMINDFVEFDRSKVIQLEKGVEMSVSEKVCKNLLVKKS